MDKKVVIIGHRGASCLAEENTLESLWRGYLEGVDALEFDIRSTKDRQFIIAHDPSIKVKDQPTMLCNLTSSEIRKLDEIKDKVPSLQQVIDMFLSVDHDVRPTLNIEIKEERSAKMLCRILREYIETTDYTPQHFLISSFLPLEILTCHLEYPELKTALAFEEYNESSRMADTLISRPGRPSILVVDATSISTEDIDELHSNNRVIYAYTVNSASEIRDIIDKGVDGIFTDRPDTAVMIVHK